MLKYYKIYRARQNSNFYSDITHNYTTSEGIETEKEALQYAQEYLEIHRSDKIKIVEYKLSEFVFTYKPKKGVK